MTTPSTSATPPARRSWLMWGITLLALGLGTVALLSGVFGLVAPGNAADRVSAVPNLLTGITGVGGAIGYGLRKRWGVLLYSLSTLGHVLVHGAFILSALGQARTTPVSLAFLTVVPVVSLLVLAGMAWSWRRGALT